MAKKVKSYFNPSLAANAEPSFRSLSLGGSSALPQAPVNIVAPVISGTTSLESVLSCTTGSWSGLPAVFTYTYQWRRNGTNISGATNSTYTSVAADSAATITCVVTANNGVLPNGTATSNGLVMDNYTPVNTALPVVSGTAVVGQTLSTTNGTWTNSPTSFSFQWFRGATPIGTNSSTYTLVQADAGNTSNITCRVTATNSAGSANATSNTIAQIFDATWWDFRQALNITDTTINNAMNTYTITRKSISETPSIAAYPMVGGTAVTHSRNLYNPADTNGAKRITWAGTVTHNANGIQGNGTNGNGNPNILTSEFSNDFTIVFYSRTNNAGAFADYGGINAGAAGITMVSRFTDNNCYAGFNSTSTNAGAIFTRTDGFILIKRSGNSVTIKRNDTTIFTGTFALVATNIGLRLLARNFNGALDNYSNRQYTHFEFMNFATTALQDTNLFNAVVAKETALSRNV